MATVMSLACPMGTARNAKYSILQTRKKKNCKNPPPKAVKETYRVGNTSFLVSKKKVEINSNMTQCQEWFSGGKRSGGGNRKKNCGGGEKTRHEALRSTLLAFVFNEGEIGEGVKGVVRKERTQE